MIKENLLETGPEVTLTEIVDNEAVNANGVHVFNYTKKGDEINTCFVWGDQDWRLYHSSEVIEHIESLGYIMDMDGRYVPVDVIKEMLLATDKGGVVYYFDRPIYPNSFLNDKLFPWIN